jgi:hypothetical protein
MANATVPSRKHEKNDVINFVLKVKSSRKKDGPIELSLDLNPELKMLSIKETFSTREELSRILKFVDDVLRQVEDRTRKYNEVLQVDEKRKGKYFNEGYDQNFKPEFGKIDKIIHRHNSPGESTVSYVRAYNGDKQPH